MFDNQLKGVSDNDGVHLEDVSVLKYEPVFLTNLFSYILAGF